MGFYDPITEFAGLPVRSYRLAPNDADGDAAEDDGSPCAYYIQSPEFNSILDMAGCCLAPLTGLGVGASCYTFAEWSGPLAALAGLATTFAIQVPLNVITRRKDSRRKAEQAQALEQFAPRSSGPHPKIATKLWDMDSRVAQTLSRFIQEGLAEHSIALLIHSESPDDFDSLRSALTIAAPALPQLRHLFINPLTQDECEVSWILNGDCAPLLTAFPDLESFHIRGGEVSFNDLGEKTGGQLGLKKIVIESGGIDVSVIQQLAEVELLQLEHLELWTGDSEYGSCDSESLFQLLNYNAYPSLRYLGIRNCEFTDEVLRWLADTTLLEQLDTLDLSKGCLGDEGAERLCSCEAVQRLTLLDLRHHFLSDEWIDRLQSLEASVNGLRIDLSDRVTDFDVDEQGEPYRFVAVGE